MKYLWKEKAVKLMLLAAASTSILIVTGIFVFLVKEGGAFVIKPGLKELLGSRWMPVSFQKESFGILPLVTGSVLVTVLATLLTIPFGISASVYISELARPTEREILKPFIEILAGIPSVVIGFLGLMLLVPLIKAGFRLSTGLTALAGAVLLALMAIPTVISISEDAIRGVPVSYKQASLALGASKMQTVWKVTVPAALPGIIAAIMLGMGRVIGETMAVMMVTGNSAILTASPFESVRTMTATIAAEMGEVAFGSNHYRALFCVGIVLLLATFGINIIAQKVLQKHRVR
ncbi:MAG: phosphate ABC transporter permease subunit PstC [Sedimentisphaerales bacterium]|nr:phosphate ABC transporter permease subunit PstC [Sedimentisphaerales bacterium]